MKFFVILLLFSYVKSNHVTRQGCTCKSSCGATVDFGSAKFDWCYTENDCGLYSYSRFAYYDFCVYPLDQAYESQTAAAKQSWLWGQIISNLNPQSWPTQAEIFGESVETSFIDNSDVMNEGRIKFIHSVGAVAKIRLVPAPNSPFSGVFRSGSQHGLLRLSTAAQISSTSVTPGMAIKFLRNNHTSGNLVAMPSLDGQTDFNIWKLNYTNHLVYPSSAVLKLVAQKFVQASNCPLMVGLSDIAEFDENGFFDKPVFPYHLVFVPNPSLAFPSAPYDQPAFLSHMEAIPVGAKLFDVFAQTDPGAAANTVVGTIVATSSFTRSGFGDASLFFKHQYMENDLALNPSWLSAVDNTQTCGTSKVSPNPPLLDSEVAAEVAPAQPPCPFARKGASGPCPMRSLH